MKQFIGAGLFIVIAASSAAAQESKLYSNPTLPSREVLDRLNMRMAWRANVPMDGRRDGFVSIVSHAGQIIASTRNGVVAAYDSETGREMWKILVGKPEDATYPPTFNSKSVLVVRGVHLFAIDRLNGRLQWQYRLPFGIASAPVADERQIYLSGLNSQVAAYELPLPGTVGAASPSAPNLHTEDPTEERYQKERDSLSVREIQPEATWRFASDHRLDFTPAMTRDSLFYATPGGHVFVLGKYPLTAEVSEVYRFQLDNRLTVAPGIYDEMAYIPTPDTNMYAISIPSGRTRWRYSAGSSVTRTPFTTDVDVYVTVERKGLVRLDRDTGETKWKLPFGRATTEAAPDVDRVLAVNPKFVYATDTGGRLLVLSRETGKQLSYYTPFREYNYHVPNESTDRLMLAANNGLIICLHDREYEKPLQYRKFDYDIQPATNRIKALKEKLARKVSTTNVDPRLPLVEILENFRRRYGIDIFLSERAFQDAGVASIRDKPVLQARVENMEVGQVLKNILGQVGASYEIVGDTVQVLPAKRAVAENPNPNPNVKPMPMPMDNLNPAMRDLLAKKDTPPAIDKFTVQEFLEQSSIRLDVDFDIDRNAFKAAGLDPEDILKKDLAYPKTKGLTVGQMLHECFAPAKCDYEVRDNTIFLVPKK